MSKKPNKPVDPTDESHPLYDPARDPTHPFYEQDKAESEPKSDSPDGDAYKVGPGFPPNEHKWKPGCPSPYPKGRPRKVPSVNPDCKKILEDALFGKVEIKQGDKKVFMTRVTVVLQQLVNQAAKGDRHARRDLFRYAAELGVDLQAKEVLADALGINDQAIVDAFVKRQQKPSPGAASDDHVKAPPDLIDDDVTRPDSNEDPAASPQTDTPAKKSAEPVLDEHGRPLPVSDIRHVREINRRRLAQQKKDQGGS
jgi:Family of unknown function (DUF5681)